MPAMEQNRERAVLMRGHGHARSAGPSPNSGPRRKPNLYYVLLRLDPGRDDERWQERFGFRQIENRKRRVLWNGVPIKCTGTCRH